MLATVRAFFSERGVMEIDTPILSHTAPIDLHIDIMTVSIRPLSKEPEFRKRSIDGYLHSSPEYAMKRLLAEGSGDIYQLSHVFRAEPMGSLHNPEFMMIEWYRVGMPLPQLIHETLDLIHLFVGNCLPQFHTYRNLFHQTIGLDYQTAPLHQLHQFAKTSAPPPDIDSWDLDTTLHFLMSFVIEPQLQGLHVITDFPPSQAALAATKITTEGAVAERFEVYFNGIELANGFHELTDPLEQRHRFLTTNLERQKLGKPELPLDEKFLAALEKGFPDSCGVAVGFDRLLMLKLGATSLEGVMPFTWDEM
jgi:lysyl-tRNA synthetase class 2